uniref:Uncharacterized protein n=1 Tax=Lotus japonicus TaxID=34305 RepID=I3S6W9_LOTJA|nr:unknown [Lotus japonicus]
MSDQDAAATATEASLYPLQSQRRSRAPRRSRFPHQSLRVSIPSC